MNTAECLMQQFGGVHIPLTEVARFYLNMDETAAKNNAAKGLIPFAFRASDSNKSEWIVDVRDLAEYLDKKRKK